MTEMTEATARTATAVWLRRHVTTIATAGCIGAAVVGVVGCLTAVPADQAFTLALLPIIVLGFGGVGVVIAKRVGNPLALVFTWMAVLGSIAITAENLYELALSTSHPLAVRLAGWTTASTFPSYITPLILLLLLFPTGSLLSPRWRPVLWVAVGASLLMLGARAFEVGSLDVNTGDVNPFGLLPHGAVAVVTAVAGPLTFAAVVASIASLVLRFRRARGDERQQLLWLVAVAVFGFLSALLSAPGIGGRILPHAISDNAWILVVLCITVGVPAATALAILKYRLYDIDVVIRKTVVFGLLVVFITVMYASIVGVVSLRFAGSQAGSFIAATALAVLFAPARDRARRIADRLVYGRRATPYEVLAEFSDRVGETYAADDVLARMATVLMEGAGASGARVLLRVGNDQREAAVAGERGPDETVIDVTHQGMQLGALAVSMPRVDPMNPAKRQLVEDLASQAGLVLRNVKLIEELKASRQRLVAAQDQERRKIERNIHDGAQQQLVALAIQLKLATQLVGKDPEAERELLAKLATQANEALEDLRDLARGIYPPLLQDKGLPAALEAQARKAVVLTTVDAAGIGRFPQDVESAVYFSCLEALQNVAKYANATKATVELSDGSGQLRFSVTDDGAGFDPDSTGYGTGLQGIADRLAAIGGALEIRSAPGAGTSVGGWVPG